MSELKDLLIELREELKHIHEALIERSEPSLNKEWYTVTEAAAILGKAPFTVREYFRMGRIPASKTESGRGRKAEWRVSRQTIENYFKDGLADSPSPFSNLRHPRI